jgi:hypothetical protein
MTHAADPVMRGLDPRIHQKNSALEGMDCRVKPGNDERFQLRVA